MSFEEAQIYEEDEMETGTKFEVKGNWHYTMVDNSIFEDERVTTNDQSVYAALCSFMSIDKHKCFPGYDILMKRAHIKTRNTLSKALKNLESYEYIHVNRRKGKANIYTVWAKETSTNIVLPSTNIVLDQYNDCTLTRAIKQKKKNKTCFSPIGEDTGVSSELIRDLSKEQREAVLRLPESLRVKTARRMRTA